ncbi:hypothetical protein ACFE04_030099 [Oxalis oulophora]
MSTPLEALHHCLQQLINPIINTLSKTQSSNIKSLLQSYLNTSPFPSNPNNTTTTLTTNFALAISLILSDSDSDSWIPHCLSTAATSAFIEFSVEYLRLFGDFNATRIKELGIDEKLLSDEERVIVEMMCDVVPILKDKIKESAIGKGIHDDDEVSATNANVPVVYAIVAANQFRWFLTKIEFPHLGKLTNLVVPCALTALDHWSAEVKGQGMISFIHVAKNVNITELHCYEDVILDACCQNIASSDEIWHSAVEMSVLLVTAIQKNNPRSQWFERMLNEMLSHLERQPRDKDRRIQWLKFIEPLFDAVGLVLLAHFRRIFPLFFQWMHADDDETVLLVLKRMHTVIRLTWIRNTLYVDRLVNELATLYKEAAMRKAREEIRTDVLQILILLQQCKGQQFERAWDKHRHDLNLATLCESLSANGSSKSTSSHEEKLQLNDTTKQDFVSNMLLPVEATQMQVRIVCAACHSRNMWPVGA